jgi:hypothetical protein
MVNRRLRKSAFWAGAVLLIGAIAGTYIVLNNKKEATPKGSQNTTAVQAIQPTDKPLLETTNDFSYTIPAGWSKLPQSILDSNGATSGAATASIPPATFNVAVEAAASSPSDFTALKKEALETIQKFQDFKLVTNEAIQVGGQSGQKYVYTKTLNDTKQEQMFIVVLHNKRAFSLLFTCATSDFSSQSPAFDTILASFRFK